VTTRRWLSPLALGVTACCIAAAALPQSDTLPVGAFSSLQPGAKLPEFWRPLNVAGAKNRTHYRLVEEGGVTVVRADAAAAASGLSRAIRVNADDFPILKWRWKISNVLKTSDIRAKAGDDYPARLYVMFDYPLEKLPFAERTRLRMARALHDPSLPAATLCYVWDGKAPVGTIIASSYTDRVRMIVVESGAVRVNQWLTVERDVAADFKAAFGENAPAVTAVALATDTDNTGETVTAYYGDISFYKQKVSR
jgi:hypothetical protein